MQMPTHIHTLSNLNQRRGPTSAHTSTQLSAYTHPTSRIHSLSLSYTGAFSGPLACLLAWRVRRSDRYLHTWTHVFDSESEIVHALRNLAAYPNSITADQPINRSDANSHEHARQRQTQTLGRRRGHTNIQKHDIQCPSLHHAHNPSASRPSSVPVGGSQAGLGGWAKIQRAKGAGESSTR